MRTIVHVDQTDIDRGKKGSHDSCPIALASTRALGVEARVLPSWLYLPSTNFKAFEHSLEVKVFIRNFDAGYAVRPFSFDVEIE